MRTTELVLPVGDVRQVTTRERVVTLDLGGRSFPFIAGQAVELGTTDQLERKPYSIACSPGQTQRSGVLEFLIQFEHDRGVSPHLMDLAPGRLIGAGAPAGTFTWPSHPHERHALLIAGGTGIAPIRSMIAQAIEEGFEGRLVLVYSARSERDLAFADQFAAWADAGRVALRTLVTRGESSSPDRWQGRLDRKRLSALVTDPETLCFLCGPKSLLEEVPAMLGELGVARSRIRVESW